MGWYVDRGYDIIYCTMISVLKLWHSYMHLDARDKILKDKFDQGVEGFVSSDQSHFILSVA